METSPKFDEALGFASSLHRGQVRKDGKTPYFAHLMSVCALVLENGGTEDQAIAALLHDSLEDQSDSYAGGRDGLIREIQRRFGETVLQIVLACSDDHPVPEDELPKDKAQRWHVRKARFLESLGSASPEALLVIAADKLNNASRLLIDYKVFGEEVWNRYKVPDGDVQFRYYSTLAEILGRRFPGELSERVSQVVATLRELRDENPRDGKWEKRTGKT